MLNSLRIVSVVVVAAAALELPVARATIVSGGVDSGSGAGIVVASRNAFSGEAASATRQGVVEFDAAALSAASPGGAGGFLFNAGDMYRNAAPREPASGPATGDDVAITGLHRIEVSWPASDPGRDVRVLTERSPASASGPTTVALLGLGLAALGLRQRRLRRRAGRRPGVIGLTRACAADRAGAAS